MVRTEGNMSLKNPVTSPGNNPGTVRLVAQRLNHYATLGPLIQKNVIGVVKKKRIEGVWAYQGVQWLVTVLLLPPQKLTWQPCL